MSKNERHENNRLESELLRVREYVRSLEREVIRRLDQHDQAMLELGARVAILEKAEGFDSPLSASVQRNARGARSKGRAS